MQHQFYAVLLESSLPHCIEWRRCLPRASPPGAPLATSTPASKEAQEDDSQHMIDEGDCCVLLMPTEFVALARGGQLVDLYRRLVSAKPAVCFSGENASACSTDPRALHEQGRFCLVSVGLHAFVRRHEASGSRTGASGRVDSDTLPLHALDEILTWFEVLSYVSMQLNLASQHLIVIHNVSS